MTDIVERARNVRRDWDPRLAILKGDDVHLLIVIAELADEIERLRAELEGKISQSYASELSRQVGELEAENELLREALRDRPRDDGTVVAVGGEPGASAGKSE